VEEEAEEEAQLHHINSDPVTKTSERKVYSYVTPLIFGLFRNASKFWLPMITLSPFAGLIILTLTMIMIQACIFRGT
jgi:hypothetical protein